jgi:addiction module HigA family antidote
MTKYLKRRTQRQPEHPGGILQRIWLEELAYTQSSFADALVAAAGNKVKKSTMQTKLNEIINGKRAMSADFAVLVSVVLHTSPRMWMNLQANLDIWQAEKKMKKSA